MRNLPPLNGVRAFEAAARHESFSKAGDELCVTAAAVSQQVKSLEQWLGVPLFQRLPRGLALTAAGRGFLPRLSDALDRLAQATDAVKGLGEEGRILTVSSTPGFAALWLAPRVWSFATQHPELDVRVATSARPPDFEHGLDLAIRYGRGHYPGFSAEVLMRDGMTPMCSPRLQEGRYPLRTVQDLRHHTLLHSDTAALAGFQSSWQDWLAVAGVRDVAGYRGLHFSDYHLVMQETIAGRGVALGHIALMGEELKSGRLIRPFEPVLATGGDYYLVYPPGAEQIPKVAAFLNWLWEQVAHYCREQDSQLRGRAVPA
jgi:LysR family transcriptional regulator, glycine cleavage system transcriptional activator